MGSLFKIACTLHPHIRLTRLAVTIAVHMLAIARLARRRGASALALTSSQPANTVPGATVDNKADRASTFCVSQITSWVTAPAPISATATSPHFTGVFLFHGRLA